MAIAAPLTYHPRRAESSSVPFISAAEKVKSGQKQEQSVIIVAIILSSPPAKRNVVKYFFLSEGWTVGRVWELGGLWNELAWRRKPDICRLNLCMYEQGERLWLYRVEEAVLMVEVKPATEAMVRPIGQVVLKRLITAEQAIELLCRSDTAAG